MQLFALLVHVLMSIIQESSSITLSDKKINVTLHDYSKSWNEARAICEANGGSFWKEDSQERLKVTLTYLSLWPSHQIWIGLHYPLNETNDNFGWTDCIIQDLSVFTFWLQNEPEKTASDRCAHLEKDTGEWRTKPCGNKHRFICHNQGGPCSFTTGSGIPISSTDYESVTVTATDVGACQTKCLSQIYNYKNCWALNYDNTSDCVLYYTTYPFLFSTLERSTTITAFHMKECYTMQIDKTDDTTVNATGSDDPDSTCSTFSAQTTPLPTTTTSTTPTPTTSTTTSTIPPTTSTTATSTSTSNTSETTTSTLQPTTSTVPSTTTPSTSAPTNTSTAAPTSSSTGTVPPTSASTTMCSCPCSSVTNSTVEIALDVKIELTRLKLEKDVKTLSSSIRKKTSAQDDRTSSKFVGVIAISLLCVQIGLFVVPDGISLVKDCVNKFSKWKSS